MEKKIAFHDVDTLNLNTEIFQKLTEFKLRRVSYLQNMR